MSSGQTAPTPYQPANQPGADASFQQGTNQLASNASNLYSSVAPQLAGVTSAVANNPYYAQAQAGAQGAANMATSTVAPQQFAGASQDSGIAALAGQAAPAYANAATGGGVNAYNQTQALAPYSVGGLLSAIPGLTGGMGAANQILQTGFDPQSALYNQQFAQQSDQSNAQAAQSGVAGSPYAAALANQANSNFNINWQNAQLNRQIQALGAYGTEQGQVANNLTNLTNSATNNATNLINTGTGALNAGINTGIGALSTLGSTTTGANAAASDLGTAGLNTMAGAAQLPYDLQLQQQQANLAALQGQIAGTNAAQTGTQQAVADQGQYLNIGQTASQGAINAAQTNNQQSNAMASGLGNLFGDVTGMFLFA